MSVDEAYLRKIVLWLNEPGDLALQQEIDTLRASSPDHEALYQEVLLLWQTSSEIKSLDHIPVAEATQRLSSKLQLTERYIQGQEVPAPAYTWLWRAAAAVIIGMAGYWLYPSRVDYITKHTGDDVGDTVMLADGSAVFMDEKTTMRYPQQWSGDERRLHLDEGNAFFSITKDKEHPFVVELEGSSVTVVGTSFNISATPNEVYVSVKTGTVIFEGDAAAGKSVLTAGRGIVYHRGSAKLQAIDITNANADAWLTHELRFTDASLQQVLQSLEHYYKVNISVEDSITNFKKFNATFKNNQLHEVLDVLEATYPIEAETSNAHVVIRSHTP
jgi:transmembrane sensor